MKKFKTKKCANSNCDESFDIKNYKKKFCCLPCKNQANYKYHQEVYSWEVKMLKSRNNNIQILEYLWNKKIFTIQEEELKKFGFDFMAGFMHSFTVKGTKIFRYGNIGLKLLSATEAKLIDFKNYEL
jgi:hypothetical protein